LVLRSYRNNDGLVKTVPVPGRTCVLQAILATTALLTSPAESQAPAELLESSSEVTTYLQDLVRQLSRQSTDLLVELDAAYTAAVRELGAENSQRLNELFDRQRAELAELRDADLPADERTRLSEQIQAELNESRNALREWYESETARIRSAHAAGRDAERTFQSALTGRLQLEQRRVLDELSDGPVDVGALLASLGVSEGPSGWLVPERPERPEIQVRMPSPTMPGNSNNPETGEEPLTAIVTTTVDAKINTEVEAPRSEIGVYSIRNIVFNELTSQGDGLLLADDVTVEIVIANRGNREWDQDGNRIELRLAQGMHDYSVTDRVFVSPRYYDSEGTFDYSIPVDGGIALPMLIKGNPRVRSANVAVPALSPIPNPFPNFRRPIRLRRIGIRSGIGPVEIEPHVWQTLDVRMYPAGELDETLTDNGAYIQFIVKPDGSLADQTEPVFYKPGPPRLIDER